jgi:hypothetical protein
MTHRIVVNVETGEVTQVEYTPEEQAEYDAAVAAQQAEQPTQTGDAVMEFQSMFNFIGGAILVAVGWWCKEIWDSVKALKSDIKAIEIDLPKKLRQQGRHREPLGQDRQHLAAHLRQAGTQGRQMNALVRAYPCSVLGARGNDQARMQRVGGREHCLQQP